MLAVIKDGKRMDYTVYTSMGNPFLAAVPIIGLTSFFIKSDTKEPSALYADGKYYQFKGKRKQSWLITINLMMKTLTLMRDGVVCVIVWLYRKNW